MNIDSDPISETWLSLQDESDRGCVIVAAAILEDRIEAAIRKKLVPEDENPDELIGSSRPIGSFSAKIDLAYRLGLYGNGDRRAFHILRKMRNDCAHEIESNNFEDSKLKNRTFHLVKGYEEILDAWWVKAREFENVKEALEEIEIDETNLGWVKIRELCGDRQLFIFIASTMVWVIEDIKENLAPIKYETEI